jgi:hypothetical protein
MKNINVCDAGAHIRSHWIPAFAGMTAIIIAALFAVPAMATQDEIDQKTVTSKYYVDQELATKQDTITTDRVVLHEGSGGDPDVTVPALVSFGTPDGSNGTDGLLGDKVGVLGGDIVYDYFALGGISEFADDGGLENFPNMDNFVPTVRAVANETREIKTGFDNLSQDVNNLYQDVSDLDEAKQNDLCGVPCGA